MPITERVAKLRRQSLDAVPSISIERAALMTAFYRQDLGPVSTPMRRALSFQYLMENRSICINPGELIVGEKGPRPKAAPTYPELCCHSLEDLDILDSGDSPASSRHARRMPIWIVPAPDADDGQRTAHWELRVRVL